jgi:hypothetical protein
MGAFDSKSVVAQVDEGNKVPVQRGPPEVAEASDRAHLRIGVDALINPVSGNNLLVTGPRYRAAGKAAQIGPCPGNSFETCLLDGAKPAP